MTTYSIIVRYAPDLDVDDQAADDRAVETAERIGRELGARMVVVDELDTATGRRLGISASTP